MAKPTPTKGAKSAKNAKPARSAKPAVTAKSVKAKPGASGKAAIAAKPAAKKAAGAKAPAAAVRKGPAKDVARKSSTPVKTQKEVSSAAKAETKKALIKAGAARKAAQAAAATKAAAGKPLSVKAKADSAKGKSAPKPGRTADAAPARTAAAPPSKNGKAPAEAPAPMASGGRTFIPVVSRPLGTYGGVLLAENPKPFPKKTPYTKTELNKLQEAMVEERMSLRRELGRMENAAMGADGGQENQGHSLHIAEHASDLQATENLLGVREMNEERLAQIEEALLKLRETQTYGLCVACGSKIGIDRLIAKPHAHLCMECRVKFEKRRPRG